MEQALGTSHSLSLCVCVLVIYLLATLDHQTHGALWEEGREGGGVAEAGAVPCKACKHF